MIRAAANLPETHVVIVGEGDRKEHLEGLIRQLGLGGRVELTGFIPDEKLRALLATSDLLCLPSIERTEAFGLVLLEAMRYSKPVVASDVSGSGMGWIIGQMETGLLVKPGDVDLAGYDKGLGHAAHGHQARDEELHIGVAVNTDMLAHGVAKRHQVQQWRNRPGCHQPGQPPFKNQHFPVVYGCKTFKSQFQNAPFCPISASGKIFNPRNTLCMSPVKNFTVLDLGQN